MNSDAEVACLEDEGSQDGAHDDSDQSDVSSSSSDEASISSRELDNPKRYKSTPIADSPSPMGFGTSNFVSTKIHLLDGSLDIKMPKDTMQGDIVAFKKRYFDLNFQFTSVGAGLATVLGAGVGLLVGAGAVLSWYGAYWNMYLYLMFLGFFHFSEYLCVALFNPKEVSSESFLLNHSLAYTVAMLSSFVEYVVELYLFPQWLVFNPYIVWPAFAVTFLGQALRLSALLTARHNFTHIVAEHKRDEHVLVTTGVYGLVRHPGYCGWFWWSVAGQMLLVNPVCTMGFALVSWSFFLDRIAYEEDHLVEFFGQDYEEHRKRVPTYIPCIP